MRNSTKFIHESILFIRQDLIGYSLPKIGTFNQLNNNEQKVALINQVGIFCLKFHYTKNIFFLSIVTIFLGHVHQLWEMLYDM